MRLLQIIDVHWWNACAYYAVELARGLAAAGEEVVVAGCKGSPAMQRAESVGLEVWPDFPFLDPGSMALRLRAFAAAARERDFDVIDAHRAPGHVWSALAWRFLGAPPVVRTRGDIRPPRRHALNRHLHRRWTAAHILPSQLMHAELRAAFDVPADRVWTIPAGIDLDRVQPTARTAAAANDLRSRLQIPAGAPVLGMVARLSPIKGHRIVIEALAGVDSDPAAHLLIVGQEEEVSPTTLRGLALELGVAEHVHLLGPQDDVRTALAASDLLVIASLGSEAICRVLLEGMAMQLPAVATPVGVIGETIEDGATGWLVAPGNVGALRARLSDLLGDWPAGRSRLREAGVRARSLAERLHGIDRWVASTREVYERVARGAWSSRRSA